MNVFKPFFPPEIDNIPHQIFFIYVFYIQFKFIL